MMSMALVPFYEMLKKNKIMKLLRFVHSQSVIAEDAFKELTDKSN